MPANVAAAATLTLAMIAVTVGTICRVETRAGSCPPAECPERADGATSANTWQASLERALEQTERGLLHMAGLPEAP